MVVGTHDAAEGDSIIAGGLCRGLAFLEKPYADAASPIGLQEHRFAEIKVTLRIKARASKWRREFVEVIAEWSAGRRAYQSAFVGRSDNHRAVGRSELRQISALIVEIALLEVGPFVKNRDAQLLQIVERCSELDTRKDLVLNVELCLTGCMDVRS